MARLSACTRRGSILTDLSCVASSTAMPSSHRDEQRLQARELPPVGYLGEGGGGGEGGGDRCPGLQTGHPRRCRPLREPQRAMAKSVEGGGRGGVGLTPYGIIWSSGGSKDLGRSFGDSMEGGGWGGRMNEARYDRH